jgi:hypothetical protein
VAECVDERIGRLSFETELGATSALAGLVFVRPLHVRSLLGYRAWTWAAAILIASALTALLTSSAASLKSVVVASRATKAWIPPNGVEWQWELDHPLCNSEGAATPAETARLIGATVEHPSGSPSCAADLGLTSGRSPVIAVDGAVAPHTNPKAYDIDGFDNTGSDNGNEAQSLDSSDSPVVAELHALGDHVICYIDVGTAESWRVDFSELKAALLGAVKGWPGEYWISLAPRYRGIVERVMLKRFEMCRNNHFDAVEPDNMDSSENGTTNTRAEQIDYDEWVAQEVHRLGMSVAQKNYEDESSTLEPYFDFVIEEQCYQYADCRDLAPYYRNHKAVLEVEYQTDMSKSRFARACKTGINSQPGADMTGLDSVYLSVNLDGSVRIPCR